MTTLLDSAREAEDLTVPEASPARRRWPRRLLVAAAVLLVVLGALAFLANRYDNAHDDEFLPGVRVAGTLVGGQTFDDIKAAVEKEEAELAATSLAVVAGPEQVELTLRELGLGSDLDEVLAEARDDADDMGLVRRVWHRLLDRPVRRSYAVSYEVREEATEPALAELAERVYRDPVNARIDTSTGMVRVIPATDGRSLDMPVAVERVHALGQQLARQEDPAEAVVEVPLVVSKASVTGFADIILVRRAENKLYHYENGTLRRTYTVATGLPRYPTPAGRFEITLKRRNPTWVNPDPTGWGKSMPRQIGPGPSNPLGTRALNLNSPGIRIHGTKNNGSLGTHASHGCIRMSIAESEELFELVEVGTPVIIIDGPKPAVTRVTGDPNAPVDLEAGAA